MAPRIARWLPAKSPPLTLAQAMKLSSEDRKNLKETARNARRIRAMRARTDPSVFNEFVLRDERSGKRIRQAPMHVRWHELINQHPRLLMWAHVDAGKTNQIAIGRVLWELGRNPNLRVMVLSKTTELAKKIVRSIGQYIKKSAELHEVFPHLKAADDASLPWTSLQLTVQRSTGSHAKDASVTASGVDGNIIGARIDLLIIDDIIDHSNTNTKAPRDSVWNMIHSTAMGRLTDGARMIVIGNAWHPEDLMHKLEKQPRFVAYRFPVIDAQGNLTWPEHWSRKRVEEARQDMGSLEFARACLCQPRDDESARFRRSFIERGLARGEGKRLVYSYADLFDAMLEEGEIDAREALQAEEALDRLGGVGIRIYTGVDLAVQKHDHADYTVLFTIAIYPNGDRRVLDILSGRWSAPEILREIGEAHRRFGGVFIVENVGSQQYLVQMLNETTSIPIIPFTTGLQKAHIEFGVEGLAVELENGKWIIPNHGGLAHKEIDAWIGEMIAYDPTSHTGDRLMACWFSTTADRRTARREDDGDVGIRVFGDDDDA